MEQSIKNGTGNNDSGKTEFSNRNVYDKNFRRKALLRNFLNNREVRNAIIARFSMGVIIFGILTFLLVPVIKRVGGYITENGF